MSGRSGLPDPRAAVRGVGVATLALEAVALLLAIQPIRMLGGRFTGAAVAVVVGLAAVAAVLAALLRFGWAWWAAVALQAAVLLAGLLHWSLAVLGFVFGLVWAFVLYVRRRVLARPAGEVRP